MASSTPWYDPWRYASFTAWASDQSTCISPVVKDNNRRCYVGNDLSTALRHKSTAEDLPPGSKRDAAIRQFLLALCCEFGTHRSKLSTDRYGVLTDLVAQYGQQIRSKGFGIVKSEPEPLSLQQLPQRSKTPEQVFIPFKPRLFDTVTVRRELLTIMDAKFQPEGHVYCASWPGRPGFVKIGYTAASPSGRVADQEKCFPGMKLEASFRFAFPEKIERLVHRELLDHRREIVACELCDHTHIEWFETSVTVALDVISNWHKLTQKDPLYDSNRTLRPTWTTKISAIVGVVTAGRLLDTSPATPTITADDVTIVDAVVESSAPTASTMTELLVEMRNLMDELKSDKVLTEIRDFREELRSVRASEDSKIEASLEHESKSSPPSSEPTPSTTTTAYKTAKPQRLQNDIFAEYAALGLDPFENVLPVSQKWTGQGEHQKQPTVVQQSAPLTYPSDSSDPAFARPFYARMFKVPRKPLVKPKEEPPTARNNDASLSSISATPFKPTQVSFPLTPPTTIRKDDISSVPVTAPASDLVTPVANKQFTTIMTPQTNSMIAPNVWKSHDLDTPAASNWSFLSPSVADTPTKLPAKDINSSVYKPFNLGTEPKLSKIFCQPDSGIAKVDRVEPCKDGAAARENAAQHHPTSSPSAFRFTYDMTVNPFLPTSISAKRELAQTEPTSVVGLYELTGSTENENGIENDKATQTESALPTEIADSRSPTITTTELTVPKDVKEASVTPAQSKREISASPSSSPLEVDQMLIFFHEFMTLLNEMNTGKGPHTPPSTDQMAPAQVMFADGVVSQMKLPPLFPAVAQPAIIAGHIAPAAVA